MGINRQRVEISPSVSSVGYGGGEFDANEVVWDTGCAIEALNASSCPEYQLLIKTTANNIFPDAFIRWKAMGVWFWRACS